jgi:hypothetical protein
MGGIYSDGFGAQDSDSKPIEFETFRNQAGLNNLFGCHESEGVAEREEELT